ncbi:uncharacterized protein LOC122861679 isoform X2 [Siniperca chuatsi]|uniref:uncharacterized protein LOC122861679 isoform X2 n=1 Tax=Siniperca chuatsi TaxID=119488 RepID=UPI001CE18F1D|nr:uncharacterized protein LOC122861679 isoform X2 [Siniperca chuatsi]
MCGSHPNRRCCRIHIWSVVNPIEVGVYRKSCSSSLSADLHTSTASDVSDVSSRTSIISAVLVTSIIPAVLGTYWNTTTSSISASPPSLLARTPQASPPPTNLQESSQVVEVAVEERERGEQEAVDLSMDIVYSTATSEHQESQSRSSFLR